MGRAPPSITASMYAIFDYIGQHLLVPILVTVAGGALIASARRYFRLGKEVTDNDARAAGLNEDLWRWVRDRNRQLENELRGLRNSAGNQLNAGSLRNKAVAAMRQALHEYRDEATSKVREFSALARSEGRWHRWHRERRGLGSPCLGLRGQERLHLTRWRQRPNPRSRRRSRERRAESAPHSGRAPAPLFRAR